jgi:hypothetical protein
MKKVYLAGRFSRFDNWKEKVKLVEGFDFYDPETDSNQSSSKTFYPDDLAAVKSADILIANPGLVPCEGTWIEIGYFIAHNTKTPGELCKNLIIVWQGGRPDLSVEFVKKAGVTVGTVEEAIDYLVKLRPRHDDKG